METAIYMLGLAIYTLVFFMFFDTDEKPITKLYARAVAQFFVAATTAYIILSLFYAITNTFCADKCGK